jgi:hypothetical protein
MNHTKKEKKMPKLKYDKIRLYRIMLREAIALLVLNGDFKNEGSARSTIMARAKKDYFR